SKAFRAYLEGSGARILHEISPDGFILRMPKGYQNAIQGGWLQFASSSEVSADEIASMNPSAALMATLWNDVFMGGLKKKGLESTGHIGSPLVGDSFNKGEIQKIAKDETELQEQGLYTPSPPYGAGSSDVSTYL